jgi:transposase
MVEWLDGFVWQHSVLKARVLTSQGTDMVDELGALRTRGVPIGAKRIRTKVPRTDFSTWRLTCPSRYFEAIHPLQPESLAHQVFTFNLGRQECLVPALVLFRALFPLVSKGVAAAFTTRPLEILCTPIERNGHWSVAMPDFRGVYNARHRRPTLEALTWAMLFPTARLAWQSVYKHASNGVMGLDLPKASANISPYGIRNGKSILVTELRVNALLALENPYESVPRASRSFLLNRNAEPLEGNPHSFYEQSECKNESNFEDLRISDQEWDALAPGLAREHRGGRAARYRPRDIADALLIRHITKTGWAKIPCEISGDSPSGFAREWRRSGKHEHLLGTLRTFRPFARYLDKAVITSDY